jgi:hypothetical protein
MLTQMVAAFRGGAPAGTNWNSVWKRFWRLSRLHLGQIRLRGLGKTERAGVVLVGRIIGWILFIGALPMFATDALLWAESGQWAPFSAGDLWYSFAPSTINSAHTAIEVYFNPYLWDPVIIATLALPAFLVPMGLGILLMLFRKRADFARQMEVYNRSQAGSGKASVALVGRMSGWILFIISPVLVVAACAHRIIGWALFIGGLPMFAMDALLWAQSGQWAPLSASQLWYSLAPSTIQLVHAAAEVYISPYLWDPVIITILKCPAFLVLMGLGAVLLLFRKRGDFVSKKEVHNRQRLRYAPATVLYQ